MTRGTDTVGPDPAGPRRTPGARAVGERTYRALFEHASDAMLLFANGAWIECNESAVALLGFDRAQLVGGTLAMIMPPTQKDGRDSLEYAAELIGRAYEGQPQAFEWRHRRADGSDFDADVRLTRVVLQGTPHLLATIRDVTELRTAAAERANLERKLLDAQRYESVARLAGGVAHDFNNLLAVILNYASLLLDRAGERDRPDLLEIVRAGERAAEVTRHLLAFSRKQVLQPVRLDLNRTVRGLESIVQHLLGADVDVATVLAPDLRSIRADPSQIEQVLLNLVVNARDAMPGGGVVTIETVNLDVDAFPAGADDLRPGAYVQLSVSDTGLGMDEQTRERLFDPFYSTKEPGRATGLGLASVYGIVTQSGGAVRVDSELGRGATFRILLPCDTTVAAAVTGDFEADDASASTVLVVDDDAAVGTVTCRLLERAGFAVLSAGGADEALAVVERHAGKIALLLTDVVMPVMSGHVLARRIKALCPGIEVLLMSGYMDASVEQGELGTTFDVLVKPFSGTSLVEKVRDVLRRARGDRLVPEARNGRGPDRTGVAPLLRGSGTVPSSLLQAVCKAVVAARWLDLDVLIDEARRYDEPFATRLAELVDAIDYDGIERLLGDGGWGACGAGTE